MGKKIPKSRKHNKLKFVDPCYSGPCRAKNKRLLPNEPPVAENEQEMSRHMAEIIELKNKAKHNKFKKRKKKKVQKDDFIIVKDNIIDNIDPGSSRAMKKVPDMKQKKHENEHQFFDRLQRMADVAIAEAKVEAKYDIELVSVDKEGNAKYMPAAKEISEKKREKRKNQKEKQQEKKQLKKDDKEFDLKKEHVQFGEVANAPPIIKAKPRKAPALNKAGKRQLALKEMLPNSSPSSEVKVSPLSTKWKSMPPDKRKNMEIERLRAVQMYRMMKNKKIP